jgi:hypothetical protein
MHQTQTLPTRLPSLKVLPSPYPSASTASLPSAQSTRETHVDKNCTVQDPSSGLYDGGAADGREHGRWFNASRLRSRRKMTAHSKTHAHARTHARTALHRQCCDRTAADSLLQAGAHVRRAPWHWATADRGVAATRSFVFAPGQGASESSARTHPTFQSNFHTSAILYYNNQILSVYCPEPKTALRGVFFLLVFALAGRNETRRARRHSV